MGWTHFILFGLCGAILCADGASARGIRLQGRATDAATSEPLALATVQVIGTFTGTIANDEGFFVLEVPDGVTANRRLELTGEVAGSALGSDVTFSTGAWPATGSSPHSGDDAGCRTLSMCASWPAPQPVTCRRSDMLPWTSPWGRHRLSEPFAVFMVAL